MRKCPFCAEEIQDAAIVCKHCGRDLAAAAAAPSPWSTLLTSWWTIAFLFFVGVTLWSFASSESYVKNEAAWAVFEDSRTQHAKACLPVNSDQWNSPACQEWLDALGALAKQHGW